MDGIGYYENISTNGQGAYE